MFRRDLQHLRHVRVNRPLNSLSGTKEWQIYGVQVEDKNKLAHAKQSSLEKKVVCYICICVCYKRSRDISAVVIL